LPAADLLLSNVYDGLMLDVTESMDLGSGIIGGVECDHLAFRTKDIDWQIWIAQGDKPYPCRYMISTTNVDQAPQYSIQIRNWRTGSEVAANDFAFKGPSGARKVELKELADIDELPNHLTTGAGK
jgi:hypothetical protein